jgi:DNA transposition AAA+ family ATPase
MTGIATEQKNEIVQMASEWATKQNMTQADLARHTGINAGYLSNMLRNQYSIDVQGKEVEISDKWFAILSSALGFSLKKQYWLTVQTKEFEQMIHELRVAKNDSRVMTLVIETGYGKTYTIEKFINIHPLHTYKITVNSMYKMRDILNDLSACLGTPVKYNTIDTMRQITVKLKQLKMSGYQPLIIIDEAENLKLASIQMLKGLYDAVYGYASIVLIGTEQLTDLLERMNRTNKNGAPQFYRRIKAGIKNINSSRDFAPFFKKMEIGDKGLQKLLNRICNNYGELHDYLEPAMKQSDEDGTPLTEDFFRVLYNMPKF